MFQKGKFLKSVVQALKSKHESIQNGLKQCTIGQQVRWSAGTTTSYVPYTFEYVKLNTLRPPLPRRIPQRLGRGNGSGKGNTCGRGTGGQKSRAGGNKPKLGFTGGRTDFRNRYPKKAWGRKQMFRYTWVNLQTLKKWVILGRLPTDRIITMKDIRDSGACNKKLHRYDGLVVLDRGAENFDIPIHIQVTACSNSAKSAIEAAGGSVTKVYYNKLGLRALLYPKWFKKKGRLLPRPVTIFPPKIVHLFDVIGGLPPDTTLPHLKSPIADVGLKPKFFLPHRPVRIGYGQPKPDSDLVRPTRRQILQLEQA
eukprot:TRINITY_DN13366_c0_g3_i1.p1 TRINITY_DN13366_c0_g3~~TRINITY_DN13366_c0_g3_i1.p1  ORF type:complete len:310 (-),score=27.61 TRINITY_DN13366_c0_g3_i1:629-1558(-)